MRDKDFRDVFVRCKKIQKSYQMAKTDTVCPGCGQSAYDNEHTLFTKKMKWGKGNGET